MSQDYSYIRDGAAIYARSFAIIRAEARLSRFSPPEERVAVRIIHACGMVEVADDIVFSPGAVDAARAALNAGAPILCDANMVAHGVTRARLPADNEVICALADPRTAQLAKALPNSWYADLVRWLPGGDVVTSISGTRGINVDQHLFSAWGEFAVFGGYTVILLVVGAWLFSRRDA